MSMESIEFTRIPDAKELAHAYIDITRTVTIRNGEEWTAFDQITQMIESDRASIAAKARAECAERVVGWLREHTYYSFRISETVLEKRRLEAFDELRLAITQSPPEKPILCIYCGHDLEGHYGDDHRCADMDGSPVFTATKPDQRGALIEQMGKALKELLEAVKSEPAMNHHKYDGVGITVNKALDAWEATK
jgi:hypothetical protein